MSGTFNEIPLRNITSLETIESSPGFQQMTFRIISKPSSKLERLLQLNAPALLILGSQKIGAEDCALYGGCAHRRDHDRVEEIAALHCRVVDCLQKIGWSQAFCKSEGNMQRRAFLLGAGQTVVFRLAAGATRALRPTILTS